MIDLVETISGELVKEIGPKARSGVEAAAKDAILRAKASEILTFVTPGGTRYAPEVSTDYAKALWCFVREKDFNGITLDSAVTAPIVSSVEDAVVAQLNSTRARDVVVKAVAPQASINGEIKAAVNEEAGWVGKEMLSATGLSPANLVAEQIGHVVADRSADILGTSTGKTVLAGIAQAATTSSGQALLAKLISLSAAKVAGSTILKASVAASLKKIGVVFLVKMLIVKVLAAAFPALAAAHIPIFWVVLPIIGAFIYHEMTHMPQKLAKSLPDKIGYEVQKNFPTITKSFAELVVADAVQQVARAKPT